MLFFRYLFDISSLRMNPCSPRFVYLFVVLRTLIRCAPNNYSPTFESNTKIQSIFDMRQGLCKPRAKELCWDASDLWRELVHRCKYGGKPMQRRALSMPRRSQCSRGELSQCKGTKKSSSAQVCGRGRARKSHLFS